MALACPNINLPEWKTLAEKLGEAELPLVQQVKSMKMYMENDEDERKALAKLNPDLYSPREKEERLRALSSSIIFTGTPDPVTGAARHEYRDRAGAPLVSVSRKLDEIPELRYRGDDAGQLYADSGTSVHSIFDQLARGGDKALINARKFAADHGVPPQVVEYANAFLAELRQTGTILSEVNLRDPSLAIAGRADIIHLKHDGTVDIYDIKTAYRTPSKIVGNKKIWDPLHEFQGYKAQRYSTQLEFYGQMVEKAIGHPVSGHFLLPIEVEFRDNVPTNPITNVTTLPKENTFSYGYQRRSRQFVDEKLGVKREAPLKGLSSVDDSSDLISRLTGTIQNVKADLNGQAEQVLAHKPKNGSNAYWNGRHWISLRYTDHAAQVQQVIDEYLNVQERNFRDLEPSVRNYIETGEDAYLDTKGKDFLAFRTILDDYKKKPGITATSLSDITGFEDKHNWLLIRKGERTDLLYVGNEELDRPFMVSRDSWAISKVFGSDRSLFGNIGFSWNDAKHDLKSKLRNTIGDAKKIEATLIAMKLKTVEPTIAFDRILIHSMSSFSPVTHPVMLTETLPIVAKLMVHPRAEAFIPTTYRQMATDPTLFSPRGYQQDYAKSYHDILGDTLSYKDTQIFNGVDNYYKSGEGLREVIGMIRDRLVDMEELGENSPENLEQRRMLGEMDFQLRGIDTSISLTSTFEKWGSLPSNISSPIIQDVVIALKNAVSRVRNVFWEGYKKDFNKATEALFKSSRTILTEFSDRTISRTTKYYEPLLEKVEYKTFRLGPDGKQTPATVRLPSFDLVLEDSQAFAALTEAQQAYIRKFNDTIQKGAEMMGITWVRGRIPLLKASFYNKFYRYTKGEESTYQGLLTKAFASMEENFNLGLEQDSSRSRVLQNRFKSQENRETHDVGRNKLLGRSQDGFIQQELHAEFETNLEVIADMFMMEATRVKEFGSVVGIMASAKDVFEYQQSKLFEDRMGVSMDWLKIFKDGQVHMRDVDTGTPQSKVVNNINKLASIALVSSRPMVASINYFSQQLSAFSQAIANSTGISRNYGLSDWNKAFRIQVNPANNEKINLLLQRMGMFDLSMTDLTNGRRREGNKSIFRLKYLYMMLSAGDWMSRGQVMIAQMLKDGTWNAHSVVDGKLVYDETKDERLNGTKLDPAKGRALKEFTMKELADQGIRSVDGRLPQAYGSSESNYMRNLADSAFGGYDRDSRANFNFVAFGKLVGLFRNWLPARMNALFDRPFVSMVNGSIHFEQKPDGTYSAVWTGRQMEGILHTLLYLGWYVGKYRNNPYQKLTPHQQNNIRIAASHAAIFGIFTLAVLAVDDDDDDKDPWRQATANTLQRSLGDIIATYNVLALKDFLHTPIAIVFIERTISQVFNVLSGEKDINKKTLNSLVGKIPIVNGFKEISSIVDGEPEVSARRPR